MTFGNLNKKIKDAKDCTIYRCIHIDHIINM